MLHGDACEVEMPLFPMWAVPIDVPQFSVKGNLYGAIHTSNVCITTYPAMYPQLCNSTLRLFRWVTTYLHFTGEVQPIFHEIIHPNVPTFHFLRLRPLIIHWMCLLLPLPGGTFHLSFLLLPPVLMTVKEHYGAVMIFPPLSLQTEL